MKAPTTLPPRTPTLHALPPVESSSPAGAFVSVFTPTAPSACPATEEVDINGIKVGAWASELHAPLGDAWKTRYFWMVACCPCVPVAQLEVRLGWTASYARALLRHAVAFAAVAVCFVASVVALVSAMRGSSRSVCLALLLVACLGAAAVVVARRLGHLRTEVRTRFGIDGSEKDDQRAALLHTSRTVRQLGRHLQCDRAVFSRAPATLQAYHV